MGLAPGDRLGIWSPNRYEWVLIQFASAKAGLILVNINPAYGRSELEFALNKVGCKVLVLAPAVKNSNYVGLLRQIAPEISAQPADNLHLKRLPALRSLILTEAEPPPGFLSFGAIEALGTSTDPSRLETLRSLLQPEDPINIQFTSGTTGLPKGFSTPVRPACMILNPSSSYRLSLHTTDCEYLGRQAAALVKGLLRHCPRYAQTPLIGLPGLARRLGIACSS